MHALLVTEGSAGDVHPFVAVGRTLRARGHDVTLLANGFFGDVVRGAGLDFVEHGAAADFKKAIENPDLWHPRKGLEIVFGEGVLPALEPTLEAIRSRRRGDTVLVAGTLALGARIAREVDGTPLATIHLAPSIFRTLHRIPRLAGMPLSDRWPRSWKSLLWKIADRMVDPLVAPRLNEVRGKHGLAPVSRILHDWIHSPDLVIGLFPDWFGPPQPDWPEQVRLTGFPLFDDGDRRPPDPELEKWLDAGDPPIVFTAGSANVTAYRFFAETVGVCRRLGRRGLLLTSRRESVPKNLPDEVRWESYVPFGRVLPRAAAFVSHGGIGSVAQGIATGIPQLATPLGFDQFDNASRLEDLGVGFGLRQRRFTKRRGAAALDRLLGDTTLAQRCKKLRERKPRDALGETAALIERLGPDARESGAAR